MTYDITPLRKMVQAHGLNLDLDQPVPEFLTSHLEFTEQAKYLEGQYADKRANLQQRIELEIAEEAKISIVNAEINKHKFELSTSRSIELAQYLKTTLGQALFKILFMKRGGKIFPNVWESRDPVESFETLWNGIGEEIKRERYVASKINDVIENATPEKIEAKATDFFIELVKLGIATLEVYFRLQYYNWLKTLSNDINSADPSSKDEVIYPTRKDSKSVQITVPSVKRESNDDFTVLSAEQSILLTLYLQENKVFLQDSSLLKWLNACKALQIFTGYSWKSLKASKSRIWREKPETDLVKLKKTLQQIIRNIDEDISKSG